MKKTSILGCGWLGIPLAKSLLEKGYAVNGSTTSLEKISVLEAIGIHSFQINLSEKEIVGDVNSFLENAEILIIDIPPKLRGNQNDASTALSMPFVSKIQHLIPHIEKSSIQKVLFVSSTSVYADLPLDFSRGDQNIITEATVPNPNNESGKQLFETEMLLQNNVNFKTTIVRFGGLIGPNRHPIHFLAGRENLENPTAPINLIHQIDCIEIIHAIVDTLSWGETFNAVAPFHPTRKDYYTQKAQELQLEIPIFTTSQPSFGKTISAEKVERILEYTFQKPQL